MPKNEWSYESPLTMPEIAERIRLLCDDIQSDPGKPDSPSAPLCFAVVRQDATSATISLTGEWDYTLIFRAQPAVTGALVTATAVELIHRNRVVGLFTSPGQSFFRNLFNSVFTMFFGSERPPPPGTPYGNWPPLLERELASQPSSISASEVCSFQLALGDHRRFMRQLFAGAAVAGLVFAGALGWQAYRDSEFARNEQTVDARVARILKDGTAVLQFEVAGEARSVEVVGPERTYRRGQKMRIRGSTANSKVEVPGESVGDEPDVWIVVSTIAAVWFGCAGVRRAWLVHRISKAARTAPLRSVEDAVATSIPLKRRTNLRSALVRFNDGGVPTVRKCRARHPMHIDALETRPCWAIGPVGDPVALVTSDPNQVFVGICSPTRNPVRKWWWNRRLAKVERQRSELG